MKEFFLINERRRRIVEHVYETVCSSLCVTETVEHKKTRPDAGEKL